MTGRNIFENNSPEEPEEPVCPTEIMLLENKIAFLEESQATVGLGVTDQLRLKNLRKALDKARSQR